MAGDPAPPSPSPPAREARELSADLYRVVAVLFVVLGHWLISAVTYDDGRFGNDYPLEVMPWTRWLTLAFQVVPVFFLVGGYASTASWADRRAAERRPTDWVRHRVGTILGPTTAYLVVALGLVAVLAAVGVGSSPLAFGGWAVAMQLWFVPVYLVVLAFTPLAEAAHRRWGLRVPAALALAVTVVDVVARVADVPAIGAANYLLCWAAIYQLGICWRTGTLTGRRALTIAVSGALVVVILLAFGWYPISMVGAPGAADQNNFPPTVALLAFGAAQSGALVAAAPAVTRWVRRSRLRRPLAVVSRNVMALYLWQMVPVVVVALVAYPAGLLPQPALGSVGWWLLRVGWVAILAIVMAAGLGLLWLGRRVFDRALPTIPVPLPAWSAAPLLVVGIAGAVLALVPMAVHGFAPGGRFPVIEAAVYVVAVAVLTLTPSTAEAVPRSDVE